MRDQSVALAARETLLRMTSDDSRRVAARAQTALEAAEDAERVGADAEASPALPPVHPPVRSAQGSRRRPPVSRRVVALGAIVAGLAVALVVILVATRGSRGGGVGATAGVAGGSDRGNFVKIPAGNLTLNPSFEGGLSGWEIYRSRRSRMRVPDAPNGHYVVRVSALKPSGNFGIDDYPDTVTHSIAGRHYVAEAWVRGAQATDGMLACLSLREKAGPHKLVGQDDAA